MTTRLASWWVNVKEYHQKIRVNLWSRGQVITWQMKNIFPLPRHLSLSNLTGMQLLMKVCYLWSHITCWSPGHSRSHDKQKKLFFHSYETCDHQTWQDDDLRWRVIDCKFTCLFSSQTWQGNGLSYWATKHNDTISWSRDQTYLQFH